MDRDEAMRLLGGEPGGIEESNRRRRIPVERGAN
jgi:hypothetical protein